RRTAPASRLPAWSSRRGCLSASRQYRAPVQARRRRNFATSRRLDPMRTGAARMLQVRLDKRRMLALGAGLLLASCKIVPQTGTPPATTPAPGPSEPSANVLPTDSDRHRVALLVPLTGANGEVGQSIANATTM